MALTLEYVTKEGYISHMEIFLDARQSRLFSLFVGRASISVLMTLDVYVKVCDPT
jgi:hypothetical protein